MPTEEQLNKDLDVRATKFWEFVDVREENECWPWIGITQQGKAVYRWNGKRTPVHVVAFELINGFVPGIIPRFCARPDCCNPRHMEDEKYVKPFALPKDPSCAMKNCKRDGAGLSGLCYPCQKHVNAKLNR